MSELGDVGARRIEWARDHMPVLAAIRDELKRKKTLRGLRIGMALHVEAKTGVLALSLREAGATIRLASCNPLSTDDSVATALVETYGLEVYAKKWETNEEYYANLLIAGKTFVVAGYGWTGRGIAMRARGMGARVVVTEVDSVKAIEASMDGFEVLPMRSAVREADFIVSATGCKDIVTAAHFPAMKDGVVLANAGHFDNEISKGDLEKAAKSKQRDREFGDEYTFPGGKRANLVAEGRLVNITAAQGHPVEIIDMSFAIQAVSAGYLAQNASRMQPRVYSVPPALDLKVARLKLRSMGVRIDHLTKAQRAYSSPGKKGREHSARPEDG